jgi:5'-nucleotidase
VINEVQAQGTTSAADEWVEVYNPCTTAFDLSGWTLVYRAAGTIGANDVNTLQSGLGTMNPGDFHLYVGSAYSGAGTPDGTGCNGLAGANGAVGLRNGPLSTGTLVDAVAYGTITAGHPFLEGSAAPALANGKSIARKPIDGYDTDNGGTDFVLAATPTPRAPN